MAQPRAISIWVQCWPKSVSLVYTARPISADTHPLCKHKNKEGTDAAEIPRVAQALAADLSRQFKNLGSSGSRRSPEVNPA
jgi:hypothetical protein